MNSLSRKTTALGGFTYFNTFQAAIVNAPAGRLIPTDANGPGAPLYATIH